ncbi:hypothetical protein QU481_13510 [Crenobacter sp. SG2303]|uniref:Uncharacterized protein n=1 Tax=Crenobacter oryzisoli TaxID=3056844 RepID=A0ABT7XQ37_9NEIS|nr:hypothetical protein [Crenobacter sp. SG2303]MDN0075904.1 hypothetical protein [Crenobacter sp. SG2303]
MIGQIQQRSSQVSEPLQDGVERLGSGGRSSSCSPPAWLAGWW